jgi:hypothetical protein
MFVLYSAVVPIMHLDGAELLEAPDLDLRVSVIDRY